MKALEKTLAWRTCQSFLRADVHHFSLWGKQSIKLHAAESDVKKSSVSPVYFGLRVSSHEWAMAGTSGSAIASTLETIESDLTELTDISGSAAHMCLFTARLLEIYSILVICVLKLHTYLHRCKISTKQNNLTLESLYSVFFHRGLNTQAWIHLLYSTCHLWG